MALEVSTVLLAIQAGVRLYGAATKAYSIATTSNPLVLPLPGGTDGISADTAWLWFRSEAQGGVEARDLVPDDELEALVREGTDPSRFSAEQQGRLIAFYRNYKALIEAREQVADRGSFPGLAAVSPDDLRYALLIDQWSASAPRPGASPLQTVAGTLVNIAVDYFVGVPGAVTENRPEGRAIKAFLEAIDHHDFSVVDVELVAPQVFVGLRDSVAANPGLFGSGPKAQQFITGASISLSRSMGRVLEGWARDAPQRHAAFFKDRMPELVARAVFEGSVHTVLAHPRHYLGAGGDEERLIQPLVETVTELVLTDDDVSVQMLVSGGGLERLVRAAVDALVENPGIIRVHGDEQGLQLLIRETIAALGGRGQIVTADLMPDILRLVLDRTAANLALIVRSDGAGPAQNMLIGAVRQMLEALSITDEAGHRSLSPALSRGQLLILLEDILDRVVDNPAWVAERMAGSDRPRLRLALDAALASLRRVDAARLSPDASISMLRAVLDAVALNQRLTETMSASGKVALSAALDAVFDSLHGIDGDADVKWRLASNRTLTSVVQIVLDRLARHQPSDTAQAVVEAALRRLIEGNIGLDELASALDAGLSDSADATG